MANGPDVIQPTVFEVRSPSSAGAQAPVEVRDMDLDDRGFAARYVTEAPLGQGGMGEVRLCRDGRTGRAVAMKLLRTLKDDPELRVRFLREAQIQAQLEHPAVVPVYDMGRNPDGAVFFTMKRVRGPTLARIVEQLRAGDPDAVRAYSPRRLLSVFTSVCLALDYAHRRGVLHRDLKPDNVMVGDFGEVYLLDWGVAAVRAELAQDGHGGDALSTSFEDQIHTEAGVVSGTPGYIAPEVLEGEVTDVRSEVYSLGVILFEILALERLHKGSARERLDSTLSGADAHISTRVPGRSVAPELEALCVRATATDPAERPPTVRELADAVERHLDGDRDLELRRAMARDEAARAAEAGDRALSEAGAEQDRRTALAGVGRALALDPDNQDARALLVKLVTHPPRELPPDAEREFADADAAEARRSGRFAAITYLVLVPLVLAPLLWMRAHEPWLLGLAFGLVAVAGAGAVAQSRFRRVRTSVSLVMFLSSTAGLTLAAQAFGPLVLAPALVGMNTMAYLVQGRVRPWLAIGIATCAILAPAFLEWMGVLPPAYAFDGGRMLILPRTVDLSPAAAMAALAIGGVFAVVLGGLYALFVHRGVRSMRRQLHLQAWQLAQVVGDQSASSSSRPPSQPRRRK